MEISTTRTDVANANAIEFIDIVNKLSSLSPFKTPLTNHVDKTNTGVAIETTNIKPQNAKANHFILPRLNMVFGLFDPEEDL